MPSSIPPDEQRAHDRSMRIAHELVWVQRYMLVLGISILLMLFLILGTLLMRFHNAQPVTVTNIPLVVPIQSYPPYPAP